MRSLLLLVAIVALVALAVSDRSQPLLITPADYQQCATIVPGPLPVKHKPIALYPERNPVT